MIRPFAGRVENGPVALDRDFDATKPSPARMYSHYLGWKDAFEADRAAAERAMRGVANPRAVAWGNRNFNARAARFIAEAGIDQFLDLGSGLPEPEPNTVTAVSEVRPDARVVLVDNDPVACVHNMGLLALPGRVGWLQADIREPDSILTNPAITDLIDFARPVGLLCVAVLHFVANEDRPYEIMSAFRSVLARGSMLAVSHIASNGTARRVKQNVSAAYAPPTKAPAVFRSARKIAEFFGDFELVEPGVVEVSAWRPRFGAVPVASNLSILGGVATAVVLAVGSTFAGHTH
jgi:S-adenosyl methyltransferase